MVKLGVNIDHVATLRQQRKEGFPDPVALAKQAIRGGADGITAHLREDRRHIQEQDLIRLKEEIQSPLNMEMAAHPDIVKIALHVKPHWCCLVPEKRKELTTEGGLDVSSNENNVKEMIRLLQKGGIKVSLFVEPELSTIDKAKALGADAVELHTGPYARSFRTKHQAKDSCTGTDLALRTSFEHELRKIEAAAKYGKNKGLLINAGHGLDYNNAQRLSQAFPFHEFNIGFSIISRSLDVGMVKAVTEMKVLMQEKTCVAS